MYKSLFTLLLTVLPLTCWSWGKEGHATVGAIADANLTDNARAKVAMWLKDDRLANGDLSKRTTLASVASWADEIKSTPEGKANGPWHFRDNEICGTNAGSCANGNCIDAKINDKLAVLAASDATLLQKNEALKWVVHLVGDLHQPLHVGGNHDKGGNDIKVALVGVRTRGRVNLHGAWDTDLVREVTKDGPISATLPANFDAGNTEQWMAESKTFSKSTAYAFEGFACNTNSPSGIVALSKAYQAAAKEVIRTQLMIAGLRLAYLLNNAELK